MVRGRGSKSSMRLKRRWRQATYRAIRLMLSLLVALQGTPLLAGASAAGPTDIGEAVLLGETGVGANLDYNPAGTGEAFEQVAARDGTVRALRVYLDATNAATQVQIGLYAD